MSESYSNSGNSEEEEKVDEGSVPRIERTDTPALQINQEDVTVKNYNVSKLRKQNSMFIHEMIEKSPSHTNLEEMTPGGGRRKSFSRKITLPQKKTLNKGGSGYLGTNGGTPTPGSGALTPNSERYKGGAMVFSKNIFNYSTKLPTIVKKRSQNFYYELYEKRKDKYSMPRIDKTPGMLDKAQKNKYIVKNKSTSSLKYADYNAFSYKYRTKNPLSDSLKLTTGLYSKMKRKADDAHQNLEITDIDDPKIQIDEKLEVEYLKDVIPINENLDAIDNEEKDLQGIKAIDSYYRHYKILDKVEQLNKFSRTKESVYTKLLKSTSQKRLLPLKMGFVGLGKSESCLDLQ